MINWSETQKQLGRKPFDLSGINPKVIVQCDICGKLSQRTIKTKSAVINNQMSWTCIKCNCNLPEVRKNRSIASRNKMKNPKIRQKISNSLKGKPSKPPSKSTKNKISKSSKKMWQEKREELMKIYGGDEFKNKMSNNMKSKWSDKDYASNRSESSKKLWSDPDYKSRMEKIFASEEYKLNVISSHNTIEYIEKMKSVGLMMWSNKKFKEKMKALFESDSFRSKISQAITDKWSDPEYRAKMEKVYNSPEYKAKMAEINQNMPKVSSIQKQLYSILDDLGIKHYREYNDKKDDKETVIGPYHFDCIVPRNGKPDLIIECQGEYWHGSKKSMARDKSKSSYISNNFNDRYEIKYLWEHEFKCRDKIVELIKYWTGKTGFDLVNFSFSNVEIKECPARDYKLLLSKYHYLPNAGRGGTAHGAYLNDKLIAVCVFSPLGRQNMPWDKKSTRELSRLCIHPRYQKKNFASWFVSRCIKALSPKYKTIISYCDTTFNHDGATYKACNFRLDGEVKPDYWYVSEDGWIMHKKTLYNHAVSFGMKESDYARLYSYTKTYGKKKLRFIFERSF